MKFILTECKNELYHLNDKGEKVIGPHSELIDDCLELWGKGSRLYGICFGRRLIGDCSGLKGNRFGLVGDCSDLIGDCSGLWGICSGLRGDCSGLLGHCSGLIGNLNRITREMRIENPDIRHYLNVEIKPGD